MGSKEFRHAIEVEPKQKNRETICQVIDALTEWAMGRPGFDFNNDWTMTLYYKDSVGIYPAENGAVLIKLEFND